MPLGESGLEGVSYGQGPVPDRDTPAYGPPHQGAGGRPRRERELALQAAPALPPRRARGLEPRSRRPKTSPDAHRRPLRGRDRARQKELADSGFDAGAETIHFHMPTPGREAPSVSTIYRVL